MPGLTQQQAANAENLSPANGASMTEDMKYINDLLNGFGLDEFPFSALQGDSTSSKQSDFAAVQGQARTCSILIQLLHSKQKEELFRKDSEDRILRLLDQIRGLEAKRHEDRIKLQDREIVGYKQSQQLHAEKQRQLETLAAGLRDELAKLKQTCLQKDRQFHHELRKREKDFEKLKDQLAGVLKDMSLREQRSEAHYVQPLSSAKDVEMAIEDVEESLEAVQASSPSVPDRTSVLEEENIRLRQLVMQSYGGLVQLVLDIFPELQLDESILSLVGSSPVEWIDEALVTKLDELVSILKDNLAAVAIQQQESSSAVHQEAIDRFKSQIESANTTILAQAETIRLLEMKLSK